MIVRLSNELSKGNTYSVRRPREFVHSGGRVMKLVSRLAAAVSGVHCGLEANNPNSEISVKVLSPLLAVMLSR